MLCGDIESNPGPACDKQAQDYFSCGYCELGLPVTWSHLRAMACDECSIWYHRTCLDFINSADYKHLENASVVWICNKCESMNYDFLHSSYINTSNYFAALAAFIIRVYQLSRISHRI